MRWNFFRSASVEGSGGQAAAPATPEATIEQDVKAIFDFDPFGPGDSVTQPATQDPPPASVTAEPAPAPTPPPVQTPPAQDPLLEAARALKTTAEGLPAAIREAQAPRPQTPQQAEPDPWQPSVDGQPLNYTQVFSQVPDQLINALGSENPLERKQAVASLMGISTQIAHRLAFKQAVETIRQEIATALPRYVSESYDTRSVQQEVFRDFYGKFTQLADPRLRPVVMQTAQELAAELGVRQWSADFRDKLGERVLSLLRAATPQGTPAVAQAPVMTGTSARPPAPPTRATEADDMFAMLRG